MELTEKFVKHFNENKGKALTVKSIIKKTGLKADKVKRFLYTVEHRADHKVIVETDGLTKFWTPTRQISKGIFKGGLEKNPGIRARAERKSRDTTFWKSTKKKKKKRNKPVMKNDKTPDKYEIMNDPFMEPEKENPILVSCRNLKTAEAFFVPQSDFKVQHVRNFAATAARKLKKSFTTKKAKNGKKAGTFVRLEK